jgi:ParB-like chromosome segregation protein Spo0J
VPLGALLPGEYPRSRGLDQEHVARLADADEPLPAILVRRSDWRVIDGMHRLLAALIRGQTTIDVEFFEGTADDAFLRAVEANVAHGLPLSQVDRRAAATRIIGSHPQMSDRAIAKASGLGAKAVASIRRRSTDDKQQLNTRVGQDGKVRPLSGVEGRRRAAEIMARDPQISLRQVARRAGISPATAKDVRERVQAGEIPAAQRPEPEDPAEDSPGASERERGVTSELRDDARCSVPPEGNRLRGDRSSETTQQTPGAVLERLLRDPSLRLKEEGRHLLRLLQQNASVEQSDLADAVPLHCGALVVNLARQYAETWLEFAQLLDRRDPSVQRDAIG